MAERYTPAIMDSDTDIKQVGFDGIVMTAGNFAAEIAKMDAIEAALQAILLGKIVYSYRLANFDQVEAAPYVPPANHMAQTHIKWLFTFKQLSNNALWHRKVPGADYSQATLQDQFSNYYMDLSAGVGLALKTAMDAFITHPESGLAGVLIDVRVFEE